MGQRTWQGLTAPLPGRTNIVLSTDPSFQPAGARVANCLPAALAGAGPVFVIGGRQPWEQALLIADEVRLTRIHAALPGDVFFPVLDPSIWVETETRTQTGLVNGEPTRLDFITLIRRAGADHSAGPHLTDGK